MIKCTIEIVEVPGKGFRIDMQPDESQATMKEIFVASCIDQALQPVFQYLMKKGERSEMIEAADAEAVQKLVEEKIRKFDS